MAADNRPSTVTAAPIKNASAASENQGQEAA